jgi:hypothetical protein
MALTKHRRRRDQLREQVLELREQGKSFDQICAELHTTIRTVRHVLYAPEAERERQRRAHERALFLVPKALGAIERQLDEGNGVLGLRLMEDLGVVGREAIQVHVNAEIAQVNLNPDVIEAARQVAKLMRESQSRSAEHDSPRLIEAIPEVQD